MKTKTTRYPSLLALAALSLGLALGCTGSAGDRGPAGASAEGGGGGGCTVTDNGDGTKTVSCSDGTSATIKDGTTGLPTDGGAGCTAAQTDGGIIVTCGDASVTISNGSNGTNGADGGNAVNGSGLAVALTPSAPPSGAHFAAGDEIVVTGTFTDKAGNPLSAADLATANLYMNGPRDVLKDKTAVALLGAATDRTQAAHHYIDLLKDAKAVWSGDKVTYTLNPITTEDPGTYSIGLYVVAKADALDQTFELSDVQILTDTIEPLITANCADCHKGAASGKLYMHHIDPGHSPKGSPALDSVPVQTCLMCHNEDGYASIQVCADGTKASGGKCADSSTPTYKVDPIVRRAHGVHMGENLTSALDTGPTGDFEAYAGLAFPADVRNCNKCHVDDSWKTKPSREACGACHDWVDWATGDFKPPRTTSTACTTNGDCTSLSQISGGATCNTTTGKCEIVKHSGGAQTDDKDCLTCHGPGKIRDIAVVHQVDPPATQYTVTITMSAAANGTDYEGTEAPVVTITMKDTSSNTVDPTTLTETNGDAVQFFVSGPREDTVPVLTTAAAAAKAGTATGSYAYNDLRVRTTAGDEDAKLTRSSTGYSYQLDPVTGLPPGTYTVLIRVRKKATLNPPYSFALYNFQVGTATAEAKIAGNCTTCHEDTRMHGYATFEPDTCKNCHDYQAQLTSTSTTSWDTGNHYGFGTTPLSRRVHGVHFGHYLNHPEQITGSAADYNDVIFPQDVRNCQTCHAASDDWKTEPSRMACLACHDSDSTVAHATLMTVDPTPATPYSGDEQESCKSCHGDGKQFSVANVHNISDPYAPPYPRDADPASF